METPDNRGAEEQVPAAYRAARSLDPAIELEAVRRFMREVAEMESALPPFTAEDAPLVSGFTPDWPDEEAS